jgi:hypothetical protein
MAGFGAYTGDEVVLKEEDRKMAATPVDKSAVIQDGYSNCTDEKTKEKLAMEYHTAMRSFNEFAFCCAGDKEEWKALLEGGPVFSLALVQTLWSANNFISGHIKDTLMFQESQPYHAKQLNKGKRFEI